MTIYVALLLALAAIGCAVDAVNCCLAKAYKRAAIGVVIGAYVFAVSLIPILRAARALP